MHVSLFDFDLPPENIALRPADPRGAARLLVVRPGSPPADSHVADLADWLQTGDLLVFNDTKVIPAELKGTRQRDGTSAAVRFTLHQRAGADRWRAFARPAKKLVVGDRIDFGPADGCDTACTLTPLWAKVVDKSDDGQVLLAFSQSGEDLDAAIRAIGAVPLPPYISGKRPADGQDRADYQTMFAAREGAVAAPTAGLHFTPELMAKLAAAGIGHTLVTLHVGAGTFLPVKAEDTDDHVMHAEWGEVSAETAARLNAVRAAGGRIVAVGTTSLRILESACDAAGTIGAFSGQTAIFLQPGSQIRAVDLLVTNFHLPKSTLFMLVATFSGLETMRAAYAHAIRAGYRFYSYGDASLLFPARSR